MAETDILQRIVDAGVIAIFRRVDPRVIRPLVEAVVAGGVQAVELTVDSEGAYDTIAALREEARGHLLVGAGTLLQPEQVVQAVAAGADFLLSPHLDPVLVDVATRLGCLMIPGVTTPSEVVQAQKAGARAFKLFPAGPLGPAYVKDLLGPFRGQAFIPTGGITPDNAADYIRAGAVAVGMGSALVPAAAVAAGQWQDITVRVQTLVERIRSAKQGT
ncbi:MAG: bifunctional 4-hydroxy-2-oxoglutarate aldolase/2-dehydro-3-deoxy-phosphogluconate aldolase [Alicyclobacillus sp.]|nr:bifunctional 4-hydroxy-2-oxoglutarate aldolase/2-dehydro-3-deoxy-phosphogluconate aldolase [Alicyclobacillus sp.]